jgi:anti-sigma factor RsiW
MFCALIRSRLFLHISDDLSAFWRSRVTRHLEGCPSCRREMAALRRMFQHVSDNASNAPDVENYGFVRSVMTRIAAESATPAVRERPSPYTAFSRIFRLRYVVAGLFVLLSGLALVRQAWRDALFSVHEMSPSLATKDGTLISHPSLNGQPATAKVVENSKGMVIIWIRSAGASTASGSHRG